MMFRSLLIILASAISMPLLAQEPFAKGDAWVVKKESSFCVLEIRELLRKTFYLAYDPDRADMMMAVTSDDFQSIEKSKSYTFYLRLFSGEQVTDFGAINARADRPENESPGFSFQYPRKKFVDGLLTNEALMIFFDEEGTQTVAYLDLDEYAAGVAEMRRCGNLVSLMKPKDPFDKNRK